MNQYAHYLESIIFSIEQGNEELAASHMQSLANMLGGQKQIADMSAPAAMTYVLALYLAEPSEQIERLRIQVRQADERGDDALRRAHAAEAEIERLQSALAAHPVPAAPARNELIGSLMVFREQRVKHHYDSAKGAEDMDKVLAAIDKYVQADHPVPAGLTQEQALAKFRLHGSHLPAFERRSFSEPEFLDLARALGALSGGD